MKKNYELYMPTRVIFGTGELNHLGEQALPGTKALLIISNGTSTKVNGTLERTQQQLALANVKNVVFDQIEANPMKSTIMEGALIAKEHGCDFIVALGGGSVMDAAKAIAAMACNPGDLWDYIQGGSGKGKKLIHDPLPLVCITTTAGTGSEVDAWGVISKDNGNEKIGFGGDDRLFPKLAIVDHELMCSVPPMFTAYQGFDALFHSTEVYISRFLNPYSEMIARTAIENIALYLPRAMKDGTDLEAREHVAFANTLSGHAMVLTSTTAKHSMEHAMSAFHHDLPHGAGLLMIAIPFYEFFIKKHACDDQFIQMAKSMGNQDANQPGDFIVSLRKLQVACGVADLKMSDYGIRIDEMDILARNARESMGGLFEANPCEMTHEDCVAIFKKAYR